MKRLLALFVAGACVVMVAGLAEAQAPKEGEKVSAKKKMTSKSAFGTVKSTAADSVVVAGKDKGRDTEWTFAVDSKTKIKKAGKDITAAELRSGDAIAVRYVEHDGKAVAQTINVRAAGRGKGPEGPAEREPAGKR